ncbi:MAG: cyclic nucleotide-binding domain-containing protein [Thiohalomonadales bacterium]
MPTKANRTEKSAGVDAYRTAPPRTLKDEPNLLLLGDGEAFRDELCQMIERAQLFEDLSRSDIELVAHYVRAYEVDRDEIIFKEGKKGSFMAILVEGKVDILKMNDIRKNKCIATIRPGKSMGEMSLLDDLPHSATGVATEKAKIIMFTRINFERMLDEQPAIGAKIMRKIARLMSLRLRQTTGILLDHLS